MTTVSVPGWIVTSDALSPAAVRVWAVIALLAEDKMPSRKRIAEGAHVAETTVTKLLADLEAASAIERAPGRAYRLKLSPPSTELSTPGSTGSTPQSEAVNGGAALVVHTPYDYEQTLGSELRSSLLRIDPPPVLLDSKRNLPHDALADACGIVASSPRQPEVAASLNGGRAAGGKRGMTIQHGIRAQFVREVVHKLANENRVTVEEAHKHFARALDAEPLRFERALADAIPMRVQLYRYVLHEATLTPTALAKWWSDLPALAQEKREGGSASLAARMVRHAADLRERGE